MKVKIKTEAITNYLKDSKMSKAKFCKLCKICPTTLNKILKNQTSFYLSSLFKIAWTMNIEVYELFE